MVSANRVFSLRRPTDESIQPVLDAARAAAPTFEHVGATKSSARITDFRYDRYWDLIGRGRRDFDAAKDGLRAWAAHAGAGATVYPRNAPLAEGETIVATVSLGPLHVLIPCRIVYVIDEPEVFGFAYATLPGHPECGEEAFLVEIHDDDVTFTVSAHSQPAELLSKLGGPISRGVQRRTNHAYVKGLRAFVERASAN